MVSASHAKFLKRQVNVKMPAVLADLHELRTHLSFLASASKNSDLGARDLLNYAMQAKSTAIQLRLEVAQLAEFRSSIRRQHLGATYDGFTEKYNRLSRKIEFEFEQLDSSVRALDHAALTRLHDPGRYGDAAAPVPVNELFGLLGQILEFWRLLLVRKKLKE